MIPSCRRLLGRLAATAIAFTGVAGIAHAGDRLTVLTGPVVLYDAVWMADVKGFYKDVNLDVDFKLFPTGATALQTFRTGVGDIVFTGDLPAISYWDSTNRDYQMITLLERDSKGYTFTGKQTINKPSDIVGKTIATRVGANGSFFISRYLSQNGLKPSDITVKNLDGQVMPSALCQGDIDGFFLWQPFGQRAIEICPDKVHEVTNAEGYFRGNAIAGARPAWLATKEGEDKAIRFLRATLKGKQVADTDFAAVAKYAKDKYAIGEEAAKYQWAINERVQTYDQAFRDDLCTLSDWMMSEKMLKQPVDLTSFMWLPGVRTLGSDKLIKDVVPCRS